jgi:hypothetical protein
VNLLGVALLFDGDVSVVVVELAEVDGSHLCVGTIDELANLLQSRSLGFDEEKVNDCPVSFMSVRVFKEQFEVRIHGGLTVRKQPSRHR